MVQDSFSDFSLPSQSSFSQCTFNIHPPPRLPPQVMPQAHEPTSLPVYAEPCVYTPSQDHHLAQEQAYGNLGYGYPRPRVSSLTPTMTHRLHPPTYAENPKGGYTQPSHPHSPLLPPSVLPASISSRHTRSTSQQEGIWASAGGASSCDAVLPASGDACQAVSPRYAQPDQAHWHPASGEYLNSGLNPALPSRHNGYQSPPFTAPLLNQSAYATRRLHAPRPQTPTPMRVPYDGPSLTELMAQRYANSSGGDRPPTPSDVCELEPPHHSGSVLDQISGGCDALHPQEADVPFNFVADAQPNQADFPPYRSLKDAIGDPSATEDLVAIDEFFRFHPPELKPHVNHTTSKDTRPPQMYDQHFHPDSRLKGVLYTPELETDLREYADKMVLRRLRDGSLPPTLKSTTFPLPHNRTDVNDTMKTMMIDESSVVRYYQSTTAEYARVVASTLFFGQTAWSHGLLDWTTSASLAESQGDRKGKGEEDVGEGEDYGDVVMKDEKDRDEEETLHLKQQHKAQHSRRKKKEKKEPGQSKKHSGKHAVADGFLQFAQVTPTEADFDVLPLCEVEKFGDRIVMLWEFKNLRAGSDKVMTAIMELTNCDGFEWAVCSKGYRSDGCKTWHWPQSGADGDYYEVKPDVGFDATGLGAADIWSPVYDGKKRHTWKTPKHIKVDKGHMTSAKRILQQAWAQAEKHDVTLVVIHAGVFEIICRRDRKRHIFYLSGIIRVSNCDYGQLQTGLYLAAIRDLELRIPLGMSSCSPNSVQESRREAAKNETLQHNLLTMACNRNQLVLNFRGEVQNTVPNKTRLCRRNSIYQRDPPSLDTSNRFVRVQVTKVLTKSVFRGTLIIDNKTFSGFTDFNKDVILKIADTETSIDQLQHEYRMYIRLTIASETRALVPVVIGFFRSPYVSRLHSSCIMMLEDVGTPMWVADKENEVLNSLEPVFRQALSTIHDAGLSHGYLKASHLLVRNFKKESVAFISFGRAHTRARTIADTMKPDSDLEHNGASIVEVEDTEDAKDEDFLATQQSTDKQIIGQLFPGDKRKLSDRERSISPGAEQDAKRPKLDSYPHAVHPWAKEAPTDAGSSLRLT